MKHLKILLTVILGIAVMGVSGCAANRTISLDSGTVSIERMPGKGVNFNRVYVHQENDEIVVSGRIKRRSSSTVTGGGHVDIAVISPEGEVLEHVSTIYVPRVFLRKSHRGSYFEVRLSVVPPDGSVIRVARHKLPLPKSTDDRGFDCGENTAVPG